MQKSMTLYRTSFDPMATVGGPSKGLAQHKDPHTMVIVKRSTPRMVDVHLIDYDDDLSLLLQLFYYINITYDRCILLLLSLSLQLSLL